MASRIKFESEYGPRSNSNTSLSNNEFSRVRSQKQLIDSAMASYWLGKRHAQISSGSDSCKSQQKSLDRHAFQLKSQNRSSVTRLLRQCQHCKILFKSAHVCPEASSGKIVINESQKKP
jgi:hypothetical protein